MSDKKLWGGRFTQGTAKRVEAYTESVSFDKALYAHDIAGSIAHAKMLGKQGILQQNDVTQIIRGLTQILAEIEEGTFVWKQELEDVHMNIEQRLTELVGDAGRKLHTGRSRNDQVALDMRLFTSDCVRQWRARIQELCQEIASHAAAHTATLLPGCTHLQAAQPVSLAQHLLAYAWMLQRDWERLGDCDARVRVSPLGAAALAGTTYPLDPAFVAHELGMHGIFHNSMDAVSDRDFVLETLFCGSVIMLHLSRLCEDLILWANPAFGFIQLPDAYATGSSIMPQKKNPDVAEIMRGKTGRAYGALVSLLTTLKGLPMTYNRDLQEDKEPLFDMHKTVSDSLELMAGMLHELVFLPQRMKAALQRGFLNATELADYLVGKGVAFRDAHHITGQAVAMAEAQEKSLEELRLEDLQSLSHLIEADVFSILRYEASVLRRESPGGTGPQSVVQQLADLRAWLS